MCGRSAWRRSDLGEHLGVDPPGIAVPALRLLARQRVDDANVLPVEPLELRPVDHVVPASRGDEQGGRHVAPRVREVAEHRPERDNAGAAGNEEQWPTAGRLPDEVPADRATELEPVTGLQLVGEVGRDLAVLDPLDRQLERAPRRAGRRSSSCAVPGSRPRPSAGRRRAARAGGRASRERRDEAS